VPTALLAQRVAPRTWRTRGLIVPRLNEGYPSPCTGWLAAGLGIGLGAELEPQAISGDAPSVYCITRALPGLELHTK
jgi:hypothetical protein